MNRIAVPLLMLGWCALAFADDRNSQNKAKPTTKFTIGKETTYVSGPLDRDGYIDYAAALNQLLGKGISPRTNGNVLLWKALGPKPEGSPMPPEFYSLLGIEPLPESRDNFIGLFRFTRDRLNLQPGKQTEAVVNQQAQALHRPWTAKEFPDLASWLKANEKALALVVEAGRRPDYFNPMVAHRTGKDPVGLVNVLLPSVQKCRELGNALAVRAMLHAGEGRADGAWQDLLACHRLALLLGRGGTLIESLVGMAIGEVAGTASVAFLADARLTSKQLQACLQDLQQLPPLPAPADKIALGERFMCLESILMLDRLGLGYLESLAGMPPSKKLSLKERQPLRTIDWDPALRKANRWYDRLVAALRVEDRAAREKQMSELEKELKELKKKAVSVQALAKMLLQAGKPDKAMSEMICDIVAAMLLPSVSNVQAKADRAEQMRRSLHLAFALAAFQRDKGAYPKQLTELAPKYLPRIPNDVFSGKALIYRPSEKGYLLYSVGLNGQDEEGRSGGDGPSGDDIAVRMPLPALK